MNDPQGAGESRCQHTLPKWISGARSRSARCRARALVLGAKLLPKVHTTVCGGGTVNPRWQLVDVGAVL
jgi:hypothetical protein